MTASALTPSESARSVPNSTAMGGAMALSISGGNVSFFQRWVGSSHALGAGVGPTATASNSTPGDLLPTALFLDFLALLSFLRRSSSFHGGIALVRFHSHSSSYAVSSDRW